MHEFVSRKIRDEGGDGTLIASCFFGAFPPVDLRAVGFEGANYRFPKFRNTFKKKKIIKC